MKARQRLLDLREELQLTQEQIAPYFNMNQTNYSKMERGTNRITKQMEATICMFEVIANHGLLEELQKTIVDTFSEGH